MPPLPPRNGATSSPSLGRVRALYDYNTGVDGDLTMYKGDTIVVTERDGDDWWKGYVADRKHPEVGMFPKNYVEE